VKPAHQPNHALVNSQIQAELSPSTSKTQQQHLPPQLQNNQQSANQPTQHDNHQTPHHQQNSTNETHRVKSELLPTHRENNHDIAKKGI
jgi:hypothetical protein